MRTVPASFVVISLFSMACGSDEDTTGPSSAGRTPSTPSTVVTAAVLCGETILTDVRLDDDLACAGDGLIVGADGIKINLHGHAIGGSGVGTGIMIGAGRRDITIFNGTIRGFVTGVFAETATEVVIKHSGFTQNQDGVRLNGASGNVVKGNVVWLNTMRGIMIRPSVASGATSTDNEIVENVLTDNPIGIFLFEQPANLLRKNSVFGSSSSGIIVIGGGATGNLIQENLLAENARGINITPGTGTGSPSGNAFVENTLRVNTCGIRGASAANIFSKNTFLANVSDFCP